MYTQLYLDELSIGAKLLQPMLDSLKNKNIVITGASGVLGRELTDVLLMCNKNYNANIGLYAVGRDENKLHNIFTYFNDEKLYLIDYDKMFQLPNKIDFIIHLASITSSKMFVDSPASVLDESYCLTKNILDFAVKKNIRMLNYVSSVEVYGKPSINQKKFTEEMHGELLTTQVRNSYPEAKRFCESLTVSYIKQFGLQAVLSRPAKVFSIVVNKNDNRVFNDFVQKAVNQNNIILKSDGKQVFTYCYGLDAVIGLLFVLLKGNCGEVYNIGNDNAVASISDIAQEIASQSGVKVEYQLEDSKKTGFVNVGHCIVDNSKINQLGFLPKFDLQKGISNLIEQHKLLAKSQE